MESILDGASDLLKLLQYEQGWSTKHRQIGLRSAESSLDELLLPQRVAGTESICGGIEYLIDCLSGAADLPLKELIGLPLEIQFVTDRGQQRRVCGIVTEARAGDSDGGLAAYRLVLHDVLAVMERRVNSRIFRYQNELEIVQILFDEWRQGSVVLADAFEYELDPLFDVRRYPPREQTMQYNESDAAFVRRLLKRRGISWCVRPGRSSHSSTEPANQVPAHTLVLFDDATRLPQSAAGTVRYHREDATDIRDVVTSWTGARKLQPGSSTRHSWDYKNPLGAQLMMTSARSRSDQGRYGNQVAASLDDYRIEIPHAGNDAEDLWRLGLLRLERHDLETKCFYGEGCVRDFCAGQYFTLAGHPEIDTHPESEREFVITELSLTARNNLPKDLTVRAERLFPRAAQLAGAEPAWALSDDAVDGSGLVQVRFTAVRRGVPIVPAFDPRADLPHPTLQSAIVVGPQNEEVHCDALGRVKIRFPGMRAADHEHAHGAGASDSPGDSAWVRVASNWAGNGPGNRQQFGAVSLPRVGTEVLVAFLGGDPDRPVIVCQVFNQRGEPPALSERGGLPGNRYQTGMRSRERGGQRGNQLRFDDTRGEISAQLASDHDASELNLGWLTHPRDNGAAEPRGEGAELRTEGRVAVRGKEGVLITAEASDKSGGTQMARAGLIGLTELMQSVVDEMARLAEQHAHDEKSTGPLEELVDKLKRWDAGSNIAPDTTGAAPIVAVTAPAGIILGSHSNVAVSSETKLDLVSGGDAAISAGRNLFMRAARGISAFAHAIGIKFVAGRGNITMEAHQGTVDIKSSGRISLISAEAIHIEAPSVRIVSQGAQTDWADGRIVQQSSGEQLFKAASIVRAGAGGGSPVAPGFVASDLQTDERLVLRHLQTREPIPGQRYIAHLEDGRTVEGTSDEHGRTALVQSDTLGPVRFELLP
jgi:type VI secretion system secreted protein VgrG